MQEARRFPLPLLLLFAAACSDYTIERQDDVVGLNEGSSGLDPDGVPPPPDGSDPGEDARDCWTLRADPATVGVDASCESQGSMGDFEVQTEWSRPEFGAYGETSQVLMAPAVGQLTDDNDDGVIDEQDVPDVVVVADDGESYFDLFGILFVVSGDGEAGSHGYFNGAVVSGEPDAATGVMRPDPADVWEIGDPDIPDDEPSWEWHVYRYSNIALGDVNGDGVPEIAGIFQGREYFPPGEGPDPGGEDTAPPPDSAGFDTDPPQDTDDDPVRDNMPDAGGDPGDPENTEDLCYVGMMNTDLDFVWVNTAVELECGGHAPAMADLEGDGDVEIVVGPYVFEAQNGQLAGQGDVGNGSYPAYAEIGYISFPLDLDGDGVQEIVAGSALYNAQGGTICQIPDGQPDGFPAAADMDLDGDGEFVVVGAGTIAIYEHDCSLVTSWAVEGGGTGGPPTLGDFDGDGYPEIGVAGANRYAVYDPDGSVIWSVTTTDESSHATGSTVFDFDGDGRAEVLYADEVALWVLDGPTGETLLYDTEHTSRTLHDFPVVVDVDGDGEAEIIVPNGGGHYGTENTGMYALGSVKGDWTSARQVWNQHAYSITNINDDLSIPSPGQANWPDYNTFRSGTIDPTEFWQSPDPYPELLEICNEECDLGWAMVLIRIANGGVVGIDGSLPVSIYAEDQLGARTLIETRWIDPLDAGWTTEGLVLQLFNDDMPDRRIVVVANDDGQSTWLTDDCSLINNELVIDDGLCPN